MKKKFALLICIITALLQFPLFCACNNFSVMDLTFFNTQVYITVKGDLSADDQNRIKNEFSKIERTFSISSDGIVSAFNSATAGETVNLDENAKTVFSLANNMHEFTDGLFNPAVLPLSRLWKLSSDTFDRQTVIATPPTADEISAILPLADFSRMVLTDGGAYKSAEVYLDFGAIAKGYAVDVVKDILSEKGVREGYISVGGSSIYVFSVKENLGIKHPRKSGGQIISVDNSLINGAPLSTSGDYIRYYTGSDGKRYSHVINGFTGYPTDTGASSVTVIAGKNSPENLRSAAVTDALSTALMLMEKDDAINFIKQKLDGFYVFIVNSAEKSIISNVEQLSVLDNNYTLEII